MLRVKELLLRGKKPQTNQEQQTKPQTQLGFNLFIVKIVSLFDHALSLDLGNT